MTGPRIGLGVLASAMLAVLLATAPVPVLAQKRVALVMGVSDYVDIGRLRNPVNDAGSIAGALEGLGFEVQLERDVTGDKLRGAVDRFVGGLTAADVALFYFAGHGMQRDGRNLLLPRDVRRDGRGGAPVAAQDVIARMAAGREDRMTIVILDACRDAGFGASRGSGTGGDSRGALVSDKPGLAPLDAKANGRNIHISFATAPGDVARDGSGANSPFTAALARRIARREAPIDEVMRLVRMDVLAATSMAQVPWVSTSLAQAFTFAGETAEAPPPDIATQDLADWYGVRTSADPERYRAYIEAHADHGGAFAAIAEMKERALRVAADTDRGRVARPATRALSVLWVDDTPDNNEAERAALIGLGRQLGMAISIEEATSTAQAMGRVARRGYDAIISDMGRIEDGRERRRAGYELLEQLRLSNVPTPFVIYSGSRKREHLDEAIRRGAQGSTNHPVELLWHVVRGVSGPAKGAR